MLRLAVDGRTKGVIAQRYVQEIVNAAWVGKLPGRSWAIPANVAVLGSQILGVLLHWLIGLTPPPHNIAS